METFKRLTIEQWRQFKSLDINFEKSMTVLTGVNGSGKTTILNLLSRHFGWDLQWISTRRDKKSNSKFWTDVWSLYDDSFTPKSDIIKIGEIHYTSGGVCSLQVPIKAKEQYRISYQDQKQINGLYIPSHTQPFSFHRVENIPTDPKTSTQQFQEYQSLIIQLYQSDNTPNPGKKIKSSLISLGVFGYGNQVVSGNSDFIHIFENFQDVLKILLPSDLGFERIEIRMPDVLLITKSGNFSLEAVSGGIGALIGISWQILMYGIDKDNFVVTFDEPENHLHPAMQRELLPNLEKAFPKAQFIISTHSPFIVSSNPNARIYVLGFTENKKVHSRELSQAELSGDYNETLKEILDVPLTIPKWVEHKIKESYDNLMKEGVSDQSVEKLKEELQRLRLYPQFLKNIDIFGGKDAQNI